MKEQVTRLGRQQWPGKPTLWRPGPDRAAVSLCSESLNQTLCSRNPSPWPRSAVAGTGNVPLLWQEGSGGYGRSSQFEDLTWPRRKKHKNTASKLCTQPPEQERLESSRKAATVEEREKKLRRRFKPNWK